MRLAVLTGLLTCVSGCGLFLDPSFPDAGFDASADARNAEQPDSGALDARLMDARGLDAFGLDAPSPDAFGLDALGLDAPRPALDASDDAPMAADAPVDAAVPVDASSSDALQPDAGRPRVDFSQAVGGLGVADIDVSADGNSVVVAGDAQSDTFTRVLRSFAHTPRMQDALLATVSDEAPSVSVFSDELTLRRFGAGVEHDVAGITHLSSAGSLFGMTLPDSGCSLGACQRFEWFPGPTGCGPALPGNTKSLLGGLLNAQAISEVHALSADASCQVAVGVTYVERGLLGGVFTGPPTSERRIYLNNTSRTSAMRTSCTGAVVSTAGDLQFGNDVAVMDTSDGPVLATTASNGVQFVTGSFPSVQATGVSSVALGTVVGAPGEAVLAYTSGGTVVVERIRQGCMESRWTWSESSLAADKVRISDCVPTPDGAQMTMVVRGRDSTLIYRLNCD